MSLKSLKKAIEQNGTPVSEATIASTELWNQSGTTIQSM